MRDGEIVVVEAGPFKAVLTWQGGDVLFERLEFHSNACVGYPSFGEESLPLDLVRAIEQHASAEVRRQQEEARVLEESFANLEEEDGGD